jgi:hypothetical protein
MITLLDSTNGNVLRLIDINGIALYYGDIFWKDSSTIVIVSAAATITTLSILIVDINNLGSS